MGLGKWWLTHGPGSPGACAKAITIDYLKWKAESPGASENDLLFMTLTTRMATRQRFGQTYLSLDESKSVVDGVDGSLPELIMYILCYEDDKINNGTQTVYWQIEKIVNETVNKYCQKDVETKKDILLKILTKGVGLIEAGDLQGGISVLNALIKEDPHCVDAFYHRGYAYGALGNHEQAIKDFDKTIALYPRKSQAHFQRGNAYLRSGNFQQAIDNYNIAIELEPHQAMNYSNRGNAYSGLANNHQALRDFSTAIELDPYYSSAYYNRGHMYSNLGNHDLAPIDYKKAIELNPQDADPYRNLAGTYFHLNNLSMAIPNFIMAAKLGDKMSQDFLTSEGISW